MPDPSDPKAHAHPYQNRRTPAHTFPGSAGNEHGSRGAAYAELAVTSNFTFLTGASHPDEFVRQAALLGYRAIAITDRNSLAGVVRAHVAAKEVGIPLVVGCRLELEEPDGLTLLVYPENRQGYRNLCRLLTLGKRRAAKGQCSLALDDVIEHNEGLLAVGMCPLMRESLRAPIPVPQSIGEESSKLESFARAKARGSGSDHAGARILSRTNTDCDSTIYNRLREVFDDDRFSIALTRLYGPEDEQHVQQTAALAASLNVPLVAVNDVYYHVPERRRLQDVLTCIRNLCTLSEAGFRLFSNGERYLKPPDEMARLFAEYPQAIARGLQIAERARGFNLDQLRYEYPDETCPPGTTPMQHLRKLTWQGAGERYPAGVPAKVKKEIEHEFTLIEELEYAPYFLTVHDLVVFARSRGILCQGRGAAANSAVCYCLGVTSVDPDRIDVLFERFVSRERNEPPDIDIDFEHERREEVIQYIYNKYGRDRAGLTAEVITYRRRSAIRDVGKALGLSLDAVDRIAKRVDTWERNPFADSTEGDVPAQLAALGFDATDHTIKLLIELVYEIMGFPRHLSQHVGGFVITRGPLCEMVPIENAAMPDRTVIEWDKDDIDAMGMLKIDVLGLGMLTAIRKALEMINNREATAATEPRSHEATKGREEEVTEVRTPKAEARTSHERKRRRSGEGIKMRAPEKEVRATHKGKRSSHKGEGVQCGSPNETRSHDGKKHNDEQHQNVSRSDRMAESDGVGQTDLSSHVLDAGQRAVRADLANEARGGVDTLKHCGGTRSAQPTRLHSVSQDGPGVINGTANATDSVRRPRISPRLPTVERTALRGGPSSPGINSQPGKASAVTALPPLLQHYSTEEQFLDAKRQGPLPPSWLRGSVASWLPQASVPPCLSLASIPPEDPTVYNMICKADTLGVFQIESRAQMTMLPRLKPRCFYDLVIEVAIVRPGPIVGEMVHPYLRRRNGEEPVPYFDETIQAVLGKTLGVPLFQEQVMALAIKAAGFSAGEAERLRRAITAWTSKDDIARYPTRFIGGMVENGYSREFAEWCFQRFKGFSQYGFPESHAASFALLVYASAWIKCYYPAVFAAALLNSQPLGFYAPAQIVRDARDHGVEVRPVDVNKSDWDCTLEEEGTEARRDGGLGKRRSDEATKRRRGEKENREHKETDGTNGKDKRALRLGLRMVSGLKRRDADAIVEAVRRFGPFASIFDLWQALGTQRFPSAYPAPADVVQNRHEAVPGKPPAEPNEARAASHGQTGVVSVSSLHRLALADAFGSMNLDRQHALWMLQKLHGKPLPLLDRETANQYRDRQGAAQDAGKTAIPAQAQPNLHDPPLTTLTSQNDVKDSARATHPQPEPRASARANRSARGPFTIASPGGRTIVDRDFSPWSTATPMNSARRGGEPPVSDLSKPSGHNSTKASKEITLPPIPMYQEVTKDYQTTGLSLKAHPVSFIREELKRKGAITAAEAKDARSSPFGRWVAVAGLVLFRQRPGTARGVMFMTLEDETGRVDLIVQPQIYKQYRSTAVYGKLVLARGRIERRGIVVHVLARKFEDIDSLIHNAPSLSRDFR